MTKKMFLVLAILLLSINYSVAQELQSIVSTLNAAQFNAQNGRLENTASKKRGKFEEIFQFSFQMPDVFESILAKTAVVLTAYKENGAIYGKHIWTSAAKGEVSKCADGKLQIAFNVNPKLRGANSYSLSMFGDDGPPLDSPPTFEQCVNSANDVCGRGRVASLSYGADGSCSYTCK